MKNWKFEYTEAFWVLLIIPVLLLLFILRNYCRKKTYRLLGPEHIRQQLFAASSPGSLIWKNIIILIGLVFLIIAIANPQTGARMDKVKVKGAEVIIALDISNSMKAEDISPSRLEKARQEIIQLLSKIRGDRVGLIIFAGKSFYPVPLTTDYAVIKMYLRGIDTDIISTQGTDIGGALKMAMKSFSEDKKSDKAIILITDGENHEENAVDIARQAAEAGISVHTIGLGRKEGVPIPTVNRYGKKEFRKDRQGNVVVSRLNEQLLNEIAAAGKGSFVLANNYGIGLDRIYEQLKGMEKTEFKEKMVIDYEDDYQLYLLIALALLVIELMILPRKNKFLARFKLSDAQI